MDLKSQMAALDKQIKNLQGPPKEAILAEVEDLIRTAPVSPDPGKPEDQAWIGRVSAALSKWDPVRSVVGVSTHIDDLSYYQTRLSAAESLMVLLHTARASLRLDIGTPLSSSVGAGDVFDYFDGIRKIIETARKDIFFIDPYLDAEFVSRYLPHAAQGVAVRLLTFHRLSTLLPAVDQFSKQHGTPIAVRSVANLHDRYVLVDGANCFQSGASFKDGAKKAPTTLTEITDAFAPVHAMYEALWANATVER
jgi:hypothetical protein